MEVSARQIVAWRRISIQCSASGYEILGSFSLRIHMLPVNTYQHGHPDQSNPVVTICPGTHRDDSPIEFVSDSPLELP